MNNLIQQRNQQQEMQSFKPQELTVGQMSTSQQILGGSLGSGVGHSVASALGDLVSKGFQLYVKSKNSGLIRLQNDKSFKDSYIKFIGAIDKFKTDDKIISDINRGLFQENVSKNFLDIVQSMSSGTNKSPDEYYGFKNRELEMLFNSEPDVGLFGVMRNPKAYGYDYIKNYFKTIQSNMNEVDKQYTAGAFYSGLTINVTPDMNLEEIMKLKRDVFVSIFNSGTNNIIGFEATFKTFIEGYINFANGLTNNPEVFDGTDNLYIKVKGILGSDKSGFGVNVANVYDPKIMQKIMLEFAHDADPDGKGNFVGLVEGYFDSMNAIFDVSPAFKNGISINELIYEKDLATSLEQKIKQNMGKQSIVGAIKNFVYSDQEKLNEVENSILKKFEVLYNTVDSRVNKMLKLKIQDLNIGNKINEISMLSSSSQESLIFGFKKPVYKEGLLQDIGGLSIDALNKIGESANNMASHFKNEISNSIVNNIIGEGDIDIENIKESIIKYTEGYYDMCGTLNDLKLLQKSLLSSDKIENPTEYADSLSIAISKLESGVMQMDMNLSLYGGTLHKDVVDIIRINNPFQSYLNTEDLMCRKNNNISVVNKNTMLYLSADAMYEKSTELRGALQGLEGTESLPIMYSIYNECSEYISNNRTILNDALEQKDRIGFNNISQPYKKICELLDLQNYIIQMIREKSQKENDKKVAHYKNHVLINDFYINKVI